MEHQYLAILDNIDVIVYVADFKTYEILYINEYTRKIFGNIEGKICWQSLQTGQDKPCSFCTNDKLITSEGKPTSVYHWEFQNTISGQWFDIRDTAIKWKDGHFVRLEVAIDITNRKKLEEELKQELFSRDELNSIFIGTELRITALKKEIAELKKKLRHKATYT
jgi:PAS domain-containing protein